MAKKTKLKKEVTAKVVPTKTFTLRRDYLSLKKGDKVKLGPKGEQFYKSLNLI